MESKQLSQTQNVVVKLATEERGVKRLKAAPSDFTELIGVVRDHKKSTAEVFKITYVDDAGDEIAVSDDEDLAAAYDWASTQTNKNIKLTVQDNLKRRRSDSKEVKEVTQKLEDMTISKHNPQSLESESSSEDEKKGGIMHKAIGIPEHKDRKQKKALRKFIKQSMKQHSKEVIQSIIHDKEEGPVEEKKTSENNQPVHVGVECDGCGVAPIVGVRYKSSVKADFDYCANCEANKPHEHPFIKIKDPSQAPKAIFTVINEEIPEQQSEQPWRRGCGMRGMRGMMRGMFGGRGCGPNGSPRRGHGHGPRHGSGGRRGGFGRRFGSGSRDGSPFQFDQDAFAAQMKEFGENMQKQFGGNSEMDPQIMKKKIGWFMRQMFCGKNPSTAGADKPFRGCHNKWQADEGRKNPKRANIVSLPEAALVGCPGDTIYAIVTLNNGGAHPYREGFHVSSCYSNEAMKGQFEEIKFPLGQVAPHANYSVKVPIKIKENVMTCIEAGQEYYLIEFGVTNSKDEKVGQKVTLKIKVIESIDEMALYEKVSMILEQRNTGVTAGGEQAQFDDVVQALKEAEYDANKALAILAAKSTQ